MTDEFDPLKEALRDSLHRHAVDAPRGDLLAERIIHTAQQVPESDRHRRRHGWRTWTLPLVAAGAVGAVVTAIVGIQNFHTTASNPPGPGTQQPSLFHTEQPTPQPTLHGSTTDAPPSAVRSGGPGELTNVHITDLTFVGDNDGWALGSADCLDGSGDRCIAMWRTTDGRHWTSMSGEQFNVVGMQDCADPCVQHIRFANDNVGYAFGENAFFMTTDGGGSWQRQPGGAIQLETLDDNVIRVTGSDSGCPGACIGGVETSAVGSSDWTPSNFQPDQSSVGSVELGRGNGGFGYLLAMRNPAGGANDETSTLYRSTDSGLTWHSVGEPCPQAGQEVDSTSVAGGDGGRVTVLCAERTAPHRISVATSADGGAHFTAGPALPFGPWTTITGDPDTVLVAAGIEMVLSTDGGATWQPVSEVFDGVSFVGFESPLVGRAVSDHGTRIWTTRDGGATWQPATIG
jgi:hypothetical protein